SDPALKDYVKRRPKSKEKFVRPDPPALSKAVHSVTDKVDLPGTDLIAKLVDVSADPAETGFTLGGYRYIGPGNQIFEGDDETLRPADKVAKQHDQEYSRISKTSHSEAELRAETDKADSDAITRFWDNSHIFDSVKRGEFPEFGALIGAGGLLAKRTYERQFGQVYPKVTGKLYFIYGS
ncbi:hypothetical protein AB9F43_32705, partial [Rhizobium leguminosarum]|uniref:hypothetical protein n=1 Tax=Rhizobium leguminosarum TaxID=384 RepID=UPI003F99D1CA